MKRKGQKILTVISRKAYLYAICFYRVYVFALMIDQIYTQECQPIKSEDLEVEGFALIGTEYKIMTTMTYPLCLFECEKDLKCMSINFDMVTQKCELSLQTKETLPKLLKERQNSKYSTNMDNRTPGPLKGSQGRPAKSCLDVLVSNHSKGTDVYWLDPPNTGIPIQAYCDMDTDGGGWTTIKRMILQSSNIPPRTKYFTYKIIAKFNENKNAFPRGMAMLDILNKMGFHQIHFYCYKKTVGRVVSIMTKNNTAGQQVVRYFTDDAYALTTFPAACGSFDRLPEDTSFLSQNCQNWGKAADGNVQVNKWGQSGANGGNRIIKSPIYMHGPTKHGFGTYYSQAYPVTCDDSFISPMAVSTLDTWCLSVR